LGGKNWCLPAKWLGVLATAAFGLLTFSGTALAAPHPAGTSSPAAKTSSHLAKKSTHPAGTSTHPPATTPNVTTTTSTSNPDLGYAALGFGCVAIALALGFIRWDRGQTLEVQERLAADSLGTQEQNAVPDVPAGQLIVDGPDRLLVGATADFVARQSDTHDQVVARWTAAPPGMLRVPSEATSRVTVSALKAGTVTLTPDRGTGKRLIVATPRRHPPELPFVGDDWGHVVVGIVVASITAALGLAGALSGEAVATILGALVGYVVARQTGSAVARSSARKADAGNANQPDD
jgi:hypothetical protein